MTLNIPLYTRWWDDMTHREYYDFCKSSYSLWFPFWSYPFIKISESEFEWLYSLYFNFEYSCIADDVIGTKLWEKIQDNISELVEKYPSEIILRSINHKMDYWYIEYAPREQLEEVRNMIYQNIFPALTYKLLFTPYFKFLINDAWWSLESTNFYLDKSSDVVTCKKPKDVFVSKDRNIFWF